MRILEKKSATAAIIALLLLVTGCIKEPVLVSTTAAAASQPSRAFTKAEFIEVVVQPACMTHRACVEEGTALTQSGANLRRIVVEMCQSLTHPAYYRGASPEEWTCYDLSVEAMGDVGLRGVMTDCKASNQDSPQQTFCVRESIAALSEAFTVYPQ